ncbi:MAG: hypothetical protein KAH32_01775, partial [Chlamydiia bacterium]|nr:hypothetical protein [Chlamydiia bacterium]
MSIFLSNLKELNKSRVIDDEQMLYLIYADAGLTIQIKAAKLQALIVKGYFKQGRVQKLLYKALEPTVATGTVMPLYLTEISKEVTKKLCKMFCIKVKGNIYVAGGGDDPIEYVAKEYLKKEFGVTYHYLIMMAMFPGKGKYNKKWEAHFLGSTYKGVPLRIKSKDTGAKFIAAAKTKDMGALLLGTYRYIQSTI